MIVKLLTEYHLEFLSLKGGCTGSSESTLVKMPHCWKSPVVAHLIFCFRYTIHNNGTLQITQLDPDHVGVYQCFLRNEAGEAWRSTWLRLYNAPPRFIHRPAHTDVIENQEVRLPCLTQGVPKPVVVWAFDKFYCLINAYPEVYFLYELEVWSLYHFNSIKTNI